MASEDENEGAGVSCPKYQPQIASGGAIGGCAVSGLAPRNL